MFLEGVCVGSHAAVREEGSGHSTLAGNRAMLVSGSHPSDRQHRMRYPARFVSASGDSRSSGVQVRQVAIAMITFRVGFSCRRSIPPR